MNSLVTHSPSTRLQRALALLPFLFIAVAGWGYLLHEARIMNGATPHQAWMPPVSGDAWSTRDFILTFWMWSVMTIAMMTPAVMPAIRAFLDARRRCVSRRHPQVDAWLFCLGYFLVWALFCAAMTPVQWQFHEHGLLTSMMESQSTLLSAALLLIAGLYQFSPWKVAFLHRCRMPASHASIRNDDAVRAGALHGLQCLASCGLLMVVMFGVGLMNLMWMGLLTLLVTLEKALRWSPNTLRRGAGVALLGCGSYLLWAFVSG